MKMSRYGKIAQLSAPSVAAIFLRSIQLIVLMVLTTESPGETRASLVSAFGVVGSFGVMTDSGAANYLLASGATRLSRVMIHRALALHSSVASVGALGSVMFALIAFPGLWHPLPVAVVCALALTQALDSTVRVARTPLLLAGNDHRFALFDAILAAGKAPLIIVSVAVGGVWPLIFMPVMSLVVLGIGVAQSNAIVANSVDRVLVRYRSILLYGLNGAASALYSQSPLLISGAMLPVNATAMLTVCYRLVQPLEILPATLGQQAIPRLVGGRVSARRLWVMFAGLGATAALALFIASPILGRMFSQSLWLSAIFLVIVLSVPLKFGNYALTAWMLARGRVGVKLRLTVGVGLAAVAGAAALASMGRVGGVAAVTLLAEVAMSGTIVWVSWRSIRGAVR